MIFEGQSEIVKMGVFLVYCGVLSTRSINMMAYNNSVSYWNNKTDYQMVEEELEQLIPEILISLDKIDRLPLGKYENRYRDIFKRGGSSCAGVENMLPSPCESYYNGFYNMEARAFFKGYFTTIRNNLMKYEESKDDIDQLKGLLGSKFMRDQYWGIFYVISNMSVYLAGDLVHNFKFEVPKYIGLIEIYFFRIGIIRALLVLFVCWYLFKRFDKLGKRSYYVMKLFPGWLLEDNLDYFSRVLKKNK